MASFAESTYIRGIDGGVAAVDDNRLRVNVKTEFDIAVENGLAFSWSGLEGAQDIGDTLLALENNSSTHLLCIEKIIISIIAVGGGVCPVFTARGVTMAGTALVAGVNLNRSSGRTATGMATCYTEETGNGEAAGSWPGRLYMPQLLTTTPYTIDVGGKIRLPNDHMIGIDSIEEPTGDNVTIIGYFVPIA